MSSPKSKRPILPFLASFLALMLSLGFSAGGSYAQPAANAAPSRQGPQAPDTADAFAHFNPVGSAPHNGDSVPANTTFTLDLLINAASNSNLTAAQSYLTYDNAVLHVLAPGTTCAPNYPASTTVAPDVTTFEAVLQNEVCNGPNPCTMRGISVPGGSLAYASGALTNCPQGCGGDFKVASVTFCAATGGRATLHWQFNPPDPATRDSEIININSENVQQRSRYTDYVINVTGPTATPGPPTWTVVANPPTDTPGPQPTTPPGSTPNAQCQMNFNDVPPGAQYYDNIRALYCMGAITGFSDGGFHPWDLTKRAQIAKILVKAFNFPTNTAGGPHFSDVPQGSTYYDVVETAFNKGLVTGYSGGLFKPWDYVKRGQIAKMVVTAAGLATNTQGGPHFGDVPSSNEFYNYVETARANNMIAGFSDGLFHVYDYAKRGQITKIVSEALDR